MHFSPYALQPPTFDIAVLVSTLRIATEYQNDALRNFSIHQLDLKALSLVDRIPIAREFNIHEWETRTIQNLVLRSTPIALEEAEVLGMQAFFEVAARRELRAFDSINARETEQNPPGRLRRPSGRYRAHVRLAAS